MNSKQNSLLFLLLFIFLFAFGLRLSNLYDGGRTYDEIAYVKPGYQFITLFKKFDFNNRFWWEIPDEPPFARYLYGLAAQFDVIGVDDKGGPLFNYDFIHARLVSVVLSSLGAVLVALIGWRFISPFIGVCAGIIFAMLPFSLGFAHLATLESFLLSFFTAGVYLFLSLLEKYSWRKIILLGIVFGLAVSAKITNVLLFPLFLLMYAICWLYQRANKARAENQKFFNKTFFAIFYVGLIGFVTFVIIWPMPWFHLDHVYKYVHDLRFSTHLSIPEVFFGGFHLVPVYYYIVLFLITTPVVILMLFVFGLIDIKRRKNVIFYLLAIWFFFPFIQSFYHMRQHGVRYIIEIYAPLALIAAIGFDSIISPVIKSSVKKFLCFLAVVGYLFLTLYYIAPYYTNYFNELVGGTHTVYQTRMFQIGWWGEGTKEAILYVERVAPQGVTVGIVERQLSLTPPSKKLQIIPYSDEHKYDYVVMHFYNSLREGFDDTYLRQHYTRIHCVDAGGACLVAIYKRN